VKEKMSGKFIVIDGPDGCGKSTQCAMLAQWLTENGIDVTIFRDPGATAIGEKIRQILLNPEHIAMSTSVEVLLYMAVRVQLWQEKMSPALQQNKCVILDRWLSSTCAYQGHAGGFGIDNVMKLAADCLERPWPDLTIILDVDPEIGLARLQREFDRIERKGDGYHQIVREGFLELTKTQKHFVVIDASGDIKTVHKKVLEVITQADFE
jgi:dTMP kinase